MIEWRKSRRSNTSGSACVEIAKLGGHIAVRDSRNPDGAKLTFDAADWRAFTRRVRSQEYDPA
jgi:hypothetical protein